MQNLKMTADWSWPLLTSLLRLVVISALMTVNLAACTKLFRRIAPPKHRKGLCVDMVFVLMIILVNLVYLSMVWVPFTLSALYHDLRDLEQMQFSKSNLQVSVADADGKAFFNAISKLEVGETSSEFPEVLLNSENTIVDVPSSLKGKSLNGNELEEEFTLEYIDIATGEVVSKNPHRDVRSTASEEEKDEKAKAAWEVFFQSQPDFQPDVSFSIPLEWQGSPNITLRAEESNCTIPWDTQTQDFITSSCAYTLAVCAFVRLLIRRFDLVPEDRRLGFIFFSVVWSVPATVTFLIRMLADTGSHFAPHAPEFTPTGYFIYSIICDVYISGGYVISVFLEWAALFTVVATIMAIWLAIAMKNKKTINLDRYGPLEEVVADKNEDGETTSLECNEDSRGIDFWVRRVVLTIAAVWSWPTKPVLVLVLFYVYGSHWTNVVCWTSHVVVAIPVVFIPLSVFLSHCHGDKINLYVIERDPNLTNKDNKEKNPSVSENINIESEKKSRDYDETLQNIHFVNICDVEPNGRHSDEVQSQARENLKFYLGKDIFRNGLNNPSHKQGDQQIILDNEWGEASISEA